MQHLSGHRADILHRFHLGERGSRKDQKAAGSVIAGSHGRALGFDAAEQWLTDYQTIMSNLLRGELDLEEQLRNNQNDKAAETFKSLKGFEDEGHEEFRNKEDN